MPKKPVPKTEGYTLRMKASEKQLFQQAAQAAGLGTAEYFSSVLQAVSYAVLKFEESGIEFSQEQFEKMLGAHVAQVIWPGLALEPEQEKPEPDKST